MIDQTCYYCNCNETNIMKFKRNIPCNCNINIHEVCYEVMRRTKKCNMCNGNMPNIPSLSHIFEISPTGKEYYMMNAQGKLHGIYISFSKIGEYYTIFETGEYSNGKKIGIWYKWNSTGDLICELDFRSSRKGILKYYNKDNTYDIYYPDGRYEEQIPIN